jgi:hypothetical protein
MVPRRDLRNLKIEVKCIKKPIAGKSSNPSFFVTLKDRSAAVECLFCLPKIKDQDLYQSYFKDIQIQNVYEIQDLTVYG